MKNNVIRSGFLSILLFSSAMLPGLTEYYQLPGILHFVSAAVFIILNIVPSPFKRPCFKLRILSDGTDLLCAFLATLIMEIVFVIVMSAEVFGMFSVMFWNYVIVIVLSENIIFWNGIIRVYCTGTMIGMKWRLIGLACGMIPVANIIALMNIIRVSRDEVSREEKREERDRLRKDDCICKTKYPILLVHGVFFRDLDRFNYWGRIPEELERNGATLFYGEQQSALDVQHSAEELAEKIRSVVKETGCEKLNLIAHSKGGLDSRYAISKLGCDKYVATLTTVNTPHRGCAFADWLLDNAPEAFRKKVAAGYNSAAAIIGDTTPDFLAAVNDLRATVCDNFNKEVPDSPQIYYQSVGSKINRPLRNIFPLSVSNLIADRFDGDNDGLVSIESAKWGEKFTYLRSSSPDGLSHADMIDLMRRDKSDFDVREFYVQLVSELREKGF